MRDKNIKEDLNNNHILSNNNNNNKLDLKEIIEVKGKLILTNS